MPEEDEEDEDLLVWKRRVEREATERANHDFLRDLFVLTLFVLGAELFLHSYCKAPW